MLPRIYYLLNEQPTYFPRPIKRSQSHIYINQFVRTYQPVNMLSLIGALCLLALLPPGLRAEEEDPFGLPDMNALGELLSDTPALFNLLPNDVVPLQGCNEEDIYLGCYRVQVGQEKCYTGKHNSIRVSLCCS